MKIRDVRSFDNGNDRYRSGTNVILLDPDIADAFPTDESVNEALRMLLNIAQRHQENQPVSVE